LVRKKFIGRHLMLRKEFSNAVLNRSKKSTIRLGIIKPRYDQVIVHSGGKAIAIVKITDVIHKRLSELSPKEVREDGFDNVNELISTLKKLYPDERINFDSMVTIIRFNPVKKLDSVDREQDENIDPGILAGIALRYLKNEIDEKERRILLELTRTNSIRKTAYNLYGDPLNRKEIRLVLRNAYRKLKNRGIL